MNPLTLDQFKILVQTWATNEADRIERCWSLRGGWESWIQVDFTAFALDHEPDAYSIERELQIYNDASRVDLLINQHALPAAPLIAVEIKAQSLGNPNLVAGVVADQNKLGGPRSPAYAAAIGVALVLLTDDGLRQAVNALGTFGPLVNNDRLALLGSVYPVGGPWAPA